MKEALKYVKNFLIILILPVIIYAVMVLVGAAIPVNKAPDNTNAKIEIFLVERGVHTDIVVPIDSPNISWRNFINIEDFPAPQPNSRYLAFGWGDLEFYKTTPQWEDLQFRTAFKALFLDSPTALHLQLLLEIDEEQNTIRLEITEEQYSKLVHYLKSSFNYKEGEIQVIPDLHYFRNDAFYKAKGSFHAFKTCNTWVNTGLKDSGLKACLWTPVSEGLFFIYP